MSDCRYKDEITCPYCGCEQSDSWEASDKGNEKCSECGKEFCYERETECHYNSYCKEGMHNYQHNPAPKIPDCYTCEHCDSSVFKNLLEKSVASMEKRAKECADDEGRMHYINHTLERDRAILKQLP